MTGADITGESAENEKYSFFGKSSFESDIGRGNLFITRGPAVVGDEQSSPSNPRKRKLNPSQNPQIFIRGFYDLSLYDQGLLVEQRFPKVLSNLRKPRVCFACNTRFSFDNELGRRNCVWHPGVLRPGNVWSCCREFYEPRQIARRRRNGCSKCDHNDAENNQRNIASITLPGVVAHHVGIPKESVNPSQYKEMPGMTDMFEIELATSDRLPKPVGRHPYQTELIERPLPERYYLAAAGYVVLSEK